MKLGRVVRLAPAPVLAAVILAAAAGPGSSGGSDRRDDSPSVDPAATASSGGRTAPADETPDPGAPPTTTTRTTGGPARAAHWPHWRGPRDDGASAGDPPATWSETLNVAWKTPLPGLGQSTPIVWGDRVYVTTAVPHGEAIEIDGDHDHGAHDNIDPTQRMRFVVLALDRGDGRVAWRRTVRDERPHESRHSTGSWASASAVTDGKRLYVSFGSRGLFALTLDGEPIWETDLGDMQVRHSHGEGSSPALHGDTLVVNWDHQGDSFIVALDTATGKERWRTTRDEITSWSSPLIVEHAGRAQAVVAATGRIRAYDLKTGDLVWECGGLSRNVVATPVASNGLVFAGNSYDSRAMLAVRLDRAKGDVTGTDAVVWSTDQHTPYVPSPVIVGDDLCFLRHLSGILTCVDAATGKPRIGPRRLPGVRQVFASPVASAGHVYIPDRSGATAVLRRDPAYTHVATNRLDDSFAASPAIAGDELFLRGDAHVYKIAAVGKGTATD